MTCHLTDIATRLWRDTRGTMQFEASILLVAVACVGCIVGLAALRGYLLEEFGNAAEALESVDQSYAIEVRLRNGAIVYGASYEDPESPRNRNLAALPACMEYEVAGNAGKKP